MTITRDSFTIVRTGAMKRGNLASGAAEGSAKTTKVRRTKSAGRCPVASTAADGEGAAGTKEGVAGARELPRKQPAKSAMIKQLTTLFPEGFSYGKEREAEVLARARVYIDEFSMRANQLRNEGATTLPDGRSWDRSTTTVDQWMRKITRPANKMLEEPGIRTVVLLMDKYHYVPEPKTIVQKKRKETDRKKRVDRGDGTGEKAQVRPYEWDGKSNILMPNEDPEVVRKEHPENKVIPPWSSIKANPAAKTRVFQEVRTMIPGYLRMRKGQVAILDGGLGGRNNRVDVVFPPSEPGGGCRVVEDVPSLRNEIGESEILGIRYAEIFSSEESLRPYREAFEDPDAEDDEALEELEEGWKRRVGPSVFYSTDSDTTLLSLLYAPRRWEGGVDRRGEARSLGGITLLNELPERHRPPVEGEKTPSPLSQMLGELYWDEPDNDFGDGGDGGGCGCGGESPSLGGRPRARCCLTDVDALARAVLRRCSGEEGYDDASRAEHVLASLFVFYSLMGCDYNDALHGLVHEAGVEAFFRSFDALSPWVFRCRVPRGVPSSEGRRILWLPNTPSWVRWVHEAYGAAYARSTKFKSASKAGTLQKVEIDTLDLVRLVVPEDKTPGFLTPEDLRRRMLRCLWYLHYADTRSKDCLDPHRMGYRRILDEETGQEVLYFE